MKFSGQWMLISPGRPTGNIGCVSPLISRSAICLSHSRGGDADFDRVAIVQDKGLTHYFRQNQLVDSLLDRRDNATVEYVSTPVQYFRSGRDVVSHEYQMRLSKQDIAEPIDVVLERDKDVGTGTWSWRIARISLRPSGE